METSAVPLIDAIIVSSCNVDIRVAIPRIQLRGSGKRGATVQIDGVSVQAAINLSRHKRAAANIQNAKVARSYVETSLSSGAGLCKRKARKVKSKKSFNWLCLEGLAAYSA